MGWLGSVAVAAVPVSLAASLFKSVFGPSSEEMSSGESDFLSALALSLSSFLRFFANSF